MAFTREDPAPGEEAGDREAMATMAFVLALRARGVRDLAVLGAMERVPRDLFAPSRFRDLARSDVALPLACGQTMSAPSTIAAMLVALSPAAGQQVLEIGTGSGYVTALLARIGCVVTSLERFAMLAAEAAARLSVLGYDEGRVRVTVGDGCAERLAGVPPEAAFDRILVNGASAEIPAALCGRLAPGGRLVGAVAGADGAACLATVERGENGLAPPRIEGRLRLPHLVAGLARAL